MGCRKIAHEGQMKIEIYPGVKVVIDDDEYNNIHVTDKTITFYSNVNADIVYEIIGGAYSQSISMKIMNQIDEQFDRVIGSFEDF
jgi:hypothetical protein